MKIKDAKIFAKNLDDNTIKQFENSIRKNFVKSAALMPDAHFGYVAPIGSVIKTKDYIVPAFVGYDIGCGVIAAKISAPNLKKKITKNQKKIFDNIRTNVAMGLGKVNHEKNVSESTKIEFERILEKLSKEKINEEIFSFIKRKGLSNLGSIGHGNHFAEIDYFNKEIWIVVHSGSRNIGHKCATHYMKEAALLSNSENSAPSAHGGTGDMKEAMKIHNKKNNIEDVFELKTSSKIAKEYLIVHDFLLEFAMLNRVEIVNQIVKNLENILNEKLEIDIFTNNNHNHVIKERGFFVHRKGATPAKKNELGIIPANMRDGSFLVKGKGSKKFLNSSSHGAGRSMSKKDARKNIKLTEFKNSMKEITGAISKETIDESPFAYKDIKSVLNMQKESIKVIKHLKPIINFKGF
jgi:tRNA-splicing ligase RtcB